MYYADVCTISNLQTCRDQRTKGGENAWRIQAHEKKINTISVNPVEQHILATSSLDRTVRLWDVRTLGGSGRGAGRGGGMGGIDPPVAPELAVLPEPATRSINSASFSPGGDQLLTVSQANQLRLYANPHKEAVGSTVAPTNSCYHDNKTGRWLAVFHAAWDPKVSQSALDLLWLILLRLLGFNACAT